MTDEDFAAWWSASHERLRAALSMSSCAEADVEDALAEATARAWTRGTPFAAEANFRSWIFVVARNLLLDSTRSRARTAPLSEDTALSCAGVEEVLELRWQLERVLERVAGLDAEERAALFGATDAPAETRREQVRQAVRRHRLRARLRDGLGGVAAGLGLTPGVFRRLGAAGRVRHSAALASVVVPLLLVTLAPHDTPSQAATPPESFALDAGGVAGLAAAVEAGRVARSAPAPTSTAGVHRHVAGVPTDTAEPPRPALQVPEATLSQQSTIVLTPPAPAHAMLGYDVQLNTPPSACTPTMQSLGACSSTPPDELTAGAPQVASR